jgi:colanic acid/amylovoran biosynthesis protein
MIEKTSASEREAYLPFLAACADEMQSLGLAPQILLHDTDADETLVESLQAALQAALGQSFPVLRERCPRRLKGILGSAKLVAGSRFHALVGALSQGTPCLAAGWSHKYRTLLEDYGCGECMLPVTAKREEVRELLARVLVEPSRTEFVANLKRSAEAQRQRVRDMWDEVDGALRLAPHAEPRT